MLTTTRIYDSDQWDWEQGVITQGHSSDLPSTLDGPWVELHSTNTNPNKPRDCMAALKVTDQLAWLLKLKNNSAAL